MCNTLLFYCCYILLSAFLLFAKSLQGQLWFFRLLIKYTNTCICCGVDIVCLLSVGRWCRWWNKYNRRGCCVCVLLNRAGLLLFADVNILHLWLWEQDASLPFSLANRPLFYWFYHLILCYQPHKLYFNLQTSIYRRIFCTFRCFCWFTEPLMSSEEAVVDPETWHRGADGVCSVHCGLQLQRFWWIDQQSEVEMNKLTSLCWYVSAQHVTKAFVIATRLCLCVCGLL